MKNAPQLGWFVVNIVVPLLAPLALLTLAKLPTFFREQSRGIFRRAVEHGQMLWAALPMSASACYLLAAVLEQPSSERELVWVSMGTHIVLIAISSAVIVVGAMESCVVKNNSRTQPNWILPISLLLTALTATAYCFAYVRLFQPAFT